MLASTIDCRAVPVGAFNLGSFKLGVVRFSFDSESLHSLA